jgi:hypothetical protein
MTDPSAIRRSALKALANAIEDIYWMSAASDFAPNGKAHKGWIKVREKVKRYEEALAAAVDALPSYYADRKRPQ